MITGGDVYQVLSALVPIYVAMALAYGSVRWVKIFTPPECAGINRFVAVFCVPFLSFHFISGNNLYTMNLKFLAADCLQKVVVLAALLLSHALSSAVSIEWVITLFSVTTLPNTLVIGVPLLSAMYGASSASLMVQIVVLQTVIWNTFLIFLFEYRAAIIFIRHQFPATADRIASIRVESDVISMSGGRDDIEADTDVSVDGKVHVTVRRTSFSVSSNNNNNNYNNIMTPRASNLTGVEIYSVPSTPRESSFSSMAENIVSGYWCSTASPRESNLEDEVMGRKNNVNLVRSVSTNSPYQKRVFGGDLHMFGWSPSKLSVITKAASYRDPTSTITLLPETVSSKGSDLKERTVVENGVKETESEFDEEQGQKNGNKKNSMPPLSVLTRLILIMVWRKIIRNPNTYGSVLGLVWALVSFRWDVKMPIIIEKSISIISDSSLGMAVFSLGLFIGLQPKLLVCGKKMALMSLVGRLMVGSIVIGVTSLAIGLRGDLFRISIVQAALPQGIVPFVFAKEYGVHPDILSAGVIFGLILALPVTIIYYIILGFV